jgi:hypothetical protein
MKGMDAKKPADDKPAPKRTRAEDAEPPTEQQFKELVARILSVPKAEIERKEKRSLGLDD